MTLRFTILGCGSSMGVPRVALGWGACDPSDPKNRRRRCSLLIEQISENGGVTRAVIDTSPDLRNQMLDAGVERLDGVLITLGHADHTHGIDDLRPFFVRQRLEIPLFLDAVTSKALRGKFDYCFETQPGTDYPPIVVERRLTPGTTVAIEGQGGALSVLPIRQDHGDIASLGFRVGGLAYSADVKAIPPESLPALANLDVWIVDALRYNPHPSHMNLDEALAWIERVKPRRAILTNLHADLDYEALRAKLPVNVEPAFDGMTLELK
jgi:phosphoribosyl 1,2-cyclic phosphate phosphodiesterase